MRRIFFPTMMLLSIAVGPGCIRTETTSEIPEWLETEINRLNVDSTVPATVSSSQYSGSTVYYISPTVPDGFGCLYDALGQVLGCPDGGIDGRGDGTYSDYFETRTDEVIVWRSSQP